MIIPSNALKLFTGQEGNKINIYIVFPSCSGSASHSEVALQAASKTLRRFLKYGFVRFSKKWGTKDPRIHFVSSFEEILF